MASASTTGVSAKCFPTASCCVNCQKKFHDEFKKYKEDIELTELKLTEGKAKDNDGNCVIEKFYKRCTGCWLMTYCDTTCQKEHWNLVHKYHCPYLSGKKVSDMHKEESCEECIAQRTTSRDQVLDINSPKYGCKFIQDSNQMKKDLGKRFEFHGDGKTCNCGNEFACEYPFPVGKIHGRAIAIGLDEMTAHATKLCSAFIVKSWNASKNKESISQLLDFKSSISYSRAVLWVNVLVYGNVMISEMIRDVLKDSRSKVENSKFDIENPWWKAIKFTVECIRTMVMYQIANMEMINVTITSTRLSGKAKFYQEHIRNVSMVCENNLWHRFKMWPSKMRNSLVLLLPSQVFCVSCNNDLSGLVVGPVGSWYPSKPSPSLFAEVASNGGIVAACSPVKNFHCGKDYLTKLNAVGKLTEEEKQEYRSLLEKSRYCHLCLKGSLSSHRCKRCYAAQYCSMECANEDFAFHKTVCSTWAQDPNRRLMSSNEQKDVAKKFVSRMWMWTKTKN